MLRHESNSGQLDDLSHIVSEFCLADPLTKSSAKPDQLVKTIETGVMQNVDVHPPFRSLLKHKAFLSQWVADYMHDARQAITFMAEDISQDMHSIFNSVCSTKFLNPIFVSRKFASAFCIHFSFAFAIAVR